MNILMGAGDSLTVNLKAHSEWIGGFTSGIGNKVAVNGSGVFDNKSTHVNGTATIGVNVIGKGTFALDEAHGQGQAGVPALRLGRTDREWLERRRFRGGPGG